MILVLNSIQTSVPLMETQRAFCAVESDSLNIICINLGFIILT
jgi:hypothetical protein